MFKFVVLSAFLAVAAAAPSGLGLGLSPLALSSPLGLSSPWGHSGIISSGIIAHQPIVAKQVISHQPIVSTVVQPAVTGQIIQSVPSAVSHQSSSVVHSHGSIVTPVITPVHKQIISSVPVVKTIAAPVAISHGWNAHAAPLAVSHGWNAHASPLALSHGWNSPLVSSW